MPITGHAPPRLSFLVAVSDSGFASFEHSILDAPNGTLVDAFDPLSDRMIEDTAGVTDPIHAVVANGRLYLRADLDRLLATFD